MLFDHWSFSSMYCCDNISSGMPYCLSHFNWFFFFIEKRWLLKTLSYETCAALSTSKYIWYLHFCCFINNALSCVFFLKWGATKIFVFLVVEHKRGDQFSKGEGRANFPWMKLWYRGKKVLINKVFDLTHKTVQKMIQKWKKVILLILKFLWNR